MQKSRAVAEKSTEELERKPRTRRPRDAAVEPRSSSVDAMGSGKVVGAVAGAIKILRYLSDAQQPVGVSRIAKDTSLNTSTTFNILRTLALNDIVNFDPFSKSYSLSLGIMEIAKGATALGGDIGAARPMMERIAHERGLTLTLWQPVSNNRKVLIMSALNRGAMRIQMTVGQRLPIYIGATGRVFAAFGPSSDAELKARFSEIRWGQPLSFDQFMDQVRDTREKGWAMDDGNFAVGTVSLAAPVLDRNGSAVMAVTATMFTGQYTREHAADIIADLQEFGEQVSRIVAG